MKRNILFTFIGGLLLFAACDPIEERESMSPAISESELASTVNITVQGNTIECTSGAKGVIFWQTSSGLQSNAKQAEFYFPLANTYTVTCTLFGGDKKVTTSQEITITDNDPEYFSDPMWNLLTNGVDGKTWVWADDIPGGKVWGNGGYLGSTAPGWWTNSVDDIIGQGASPDDELYFDLNAALNFSVVSPNGTPGNGSGSFDLKLGQENQLLNADGNAIWSYGKLMLTNHTIPLGVDVNHDNAVQYSFDILKLTENELVLAFPEPDQGAWGTAWFYMFKRKGYVYP